MEELLLGCEPELASQVDAHATEDARDRRLVPGGEQHRRAGLAPERVELALREELRDRRPHLVAVVDEVRQPLRPPLLRDLLEPLQLRPRERARRDEEAHRLRPAEYAELRAARHLGRVLDLEAEAKVGLVGAVAGERVRVGEARERP